MKQDLQSKLEETLRNSHKNYHDPRFLSSDPLEFVHHYSDPMDQEAVALIAALLAYGNVKQIRKSIQNALKLFSEVSNSPQEFIKQLSEAKHRKRAFRLFETYVHRFNSGSDLIQLMGLLSKSWSLHGSLGSHFVSYLNSEDKNIGNALSCLIADWNQWLDLKSPSSVSYFLTSPHQGSCCKRWCMFLRWMGRKDKLDPGLWSKTGALAHGFPSQRYLSPHQLVMPIDTHIGRISQSLGLTSRRSLNWKAALEITEALKAFDPKDPVRYDFALSRLGIIKENKL